MSSYPFAKQRSRISRVCSLTRDDMYRIIEHGIDPVDRVGLARECRDRMAEAVTVLFHNGSKRLPGVADELYRSLAVALRAIEWLLRPRFGEPEDERPIELEVAEILTEVVNLILEAGTLKIIQLRTLSRSLGPLLSRTDDLMRMSRDANPRVFRSDETRIKVGSYAIGVSILLTKARSAIPHKIAKSRKRRTPQGT